MIRLPHVLLAAAFALPGVLFGQNLTFTGAAPDATLIELYTSEGCSSCPPAEAWLSGLKSSPSLWKTIFPAAFHVTYWDDLGWTDPFAQPAFTHRQWETAARLGQSSVYTPEFITNGREWRGWFDGKTWSAPSPATSGKLSLVVKPNGQGTADYAAASGGHSTAWTLNVAWLAMAQTSDVTAGENGGRKLVHDFLVLQFQSRPMTATDPGHATSEFSLGDAKKIPDAVIAWVGTTDQPVVQIAGGPLR